MCFITLSNPGYHDAGNDYIDGLMDEFADTQSKNGSALSLEALQLMTRFLNGEMGPVERASETNHDKIQSPFDGPDPDTEDDVRLYLGMYYVDEDRRISDGIDITAAAMLVENRTIDDYTLVFADGLENWTPFQELQAEIRLVVNLRVDDKLLHRCSTLTFEHSYTYS